MKNIEKNVFQSFTDLENTNDSMIVTNDGYSTAASYACMIVRLLAAGTMYAKDQACTTYKALNLPLIEILSRSMDLHNLPATIADSVTVDPIPCEYLLYLDSVFSSCIPELYGEQSDNGVDDLAQLMSVLLTNSIETEEGLNSLILPVAFMNHDCDSNVSISSDSSRSGHTAYAVASKDIKAGEELTLCYTKHGLNRKERRQQLKSHYGFDCMCRKCNNFK
jgi:hypothetical protein